MFCDATVNVLSLRARHASSIPWSVEKSTSKFMDMRSLRSRELFFYMVAISDDTASKALKFNSQQA